MVLSDYRYSFKSGLKREVDSRILIFGLTLIIPSLILLHEPGLPWINPDAWMVLPIILGFLTSHIFAGKRNKTMFLCPMSRRERVRYFNTAYAVGVIGVMTVSVIINAIFAVKSEISPDILGWCQLVIAGYVCSVNVYSLPVEKDEFNGYYKYNLPGDYRTWEVWSLFGGLTLINLLLNVPTNINYQMPEWEDWLLKALAVGYVIFSGWMIQTYYRPVQEQMVDYEIKEWKY